MNKQDFLKSQTCVLRVNIHCDGCKQKVKKKLQKIDGVYTVKIDSEQSKVTVTGDVDPATLVNKLVKSGKHAELWGPQKGGGAGGGFNLNNQFKNMQMDNFKGGKLDPKSQKGSGKDHNPKAGNAQQQQQFLQQMQNMNPKGGNVQQQQQFLQQMQNMKGMNLKDMKFPSNPKEQKNVKFNLPEEDDSEFGDEFDDEFDDDYDDDEFDDEYDDEFEGPLQHKPAKTIPIMGGGGHGGAKGSGGGHGGAKGGGGHGGAKGSGGGHGGAKGGGGHGGAKSSGGGIMKGLLKGVFGSSVGKEKKGGGGGDMTMQLKGKGGKNEGKNGNGGKNGKGGNQNEGGKKGGKNGGGMPGEGKNGNGKGGNNHHGGGGGGGGGKMNGGGGNFMMNNLQQQGFHDMDLGNKGGMGDGRNIMGQMPQMGNHNPMGGGQMGNMQAVQGLPAGASAAMNGGSYYQGMGQGNPYMNQQQQQQMAQMMMMNQQQQQANGHGMYHPMMYARPQPPMYYGPPMAGHPGNDNYAHIFSDENTGSCSIM